MIELNRESRKIEKLSNLERRGIKEEEKVLLIESIIVIIIIIIAMIIIVWMIW
jgi:hypothetical protein